MVGDRDEYVWVVVSEDEVAAQPAQPGALKGGNLRDGLTEKLAAARRVSVAELEQKMGQFLSVVGRLFRQAEQQAQMTTRAQPDGTVSSLKLDEVEMAIEITAGGEIKLIAGGKAETKGSIKLKFKRVDG